MHVFESINTQRYAKCIEVSKRVHWDIERDVIRGRDFDVADKFLPDALSFACPAYDLMRQFGMCLPPRRVKPPDAKARWRLTLG